MLMSLVRTCLLLSVCKYLFCFSTLLCPLAVPVGRKCQAMNPNCFILMYTTVIVACFSIRLVSSSSAAELNDGGMFPSIWPLPWEFSFGNTALSVDPSLSLVVGGRGGNSTIVKDAFNRYRKIVFGHDDPFSIFHHRFRGRKTIYDIGSLKIISHSGMEELQFGVDESYALSIANSGGMSVTWETIIEANTIFGALRGLETFSQLCAFDFEAKLVLIKKSPWLIHDKPRFTYRGLLIDTSRHYLPFDVIKKIIDSMSFVKLNVLHWHIVDKQSFPLEVPTYPNLWRSSYTKMERYTVEDAYEIVNYAKMRGINVMAEIDVPGHAESWGVGYPDLWPSPTCREPLDVSKDFTFDVLSGILTDLSKIFPFELFHLGGDEVNTDCWSSTLPVKKWLQDHNLTVNDAYKYFVLRAQEIAISHGWTPINWEETFNSFAADLHPNTIVHNWLSGDTCSKAVAMGLKCIFSNQNVWYLDHLDIQWDNVYMAEPLEGITNSFEQELVLGGEVCMWSETADTSDIHQTIWPRTAAAAERLWSRREVSAGNITLTALPRLHYLRCLLIARGVQAAPVTNKFARQPPIGPGSCFAQ